MLYASDLGLYTTFNLRVLSWLNSLNEVIKSRIMTKVRENKINNLVVIGKKEKEKENKVKKKKK